MTLFLEYFGECTIRVTVLLEYLNHTFSICGCHLFYNSLIFHPILFYFGKGSLVHFHGNFQLFLLAVCVILVETLDFLIMQNRSCNWDKLHISVVSYN